jgi:hypothetical protein
MLIVGTPNMCLIVTWSLTHDPRRPSCVEQRCMLLWHVKTPINLPPDLFPCNNGASSQPCMLTGFQILPITTLRLVVTSPSLITTLVAIIVVPAHDNLAPEAQIMSLWSPKWRKQSDHQCTSSQPCACKGFRILPATNPCLIVAFPCLTMTLVAMVIIAASSNLAP